MINKKAKQTCYVCSAFKENLISEIFIAASLEEANSLFKLKFGLLPQIVLGPFFKKRVKSAQIEKSIKFDGKPRKASYNGYIVNAFLLKEPSDSAFLIFVKSIDDQNKQLPKGTVIVPVNDIRFL